MKKSLFILSFSFFSLSLANSKIIENQKTNKSSKSNFNYLDKHFVKIPKHKTSNFKNRVLKFLCSSTSGLALLGLYFKTTSPIYYQNKTRQIYYFETQINNAPPIIDSQVTSQKTLKYDPLLIALGLTISSYATWLIYNKIHDYILDKYQQEELKKIIAQWDEVKNLVEPKFRYLLNNINIKYKHNPNDVDFGEASQKLRELIEK